MTQQLHTQQQHNFTDCMSVPTSAACLNKHDSVSVNTSTDPPLVQQLLSVSTSLAAHQAHPLALCEQQNKVTAKTWWSSRADPKLSISRWQSDLEDASGRCKSGTADVLAYLLIYASARVVSVCI